MIGREASTPGDPRMAAMADERAGAVGVQTRPEAGAGAQLRRVIDVVVSVVCAVVCAVGRAVRDGVRVAIAWCVGHPVGEQVGAVAPWQGASGGGLPSYGGVPGQADAKRMAREVGRLLTGLGAAPGDVAASLYALGARGVPRDPARAPVSAYLSAVLGADPEVAALGLRTDAVSLYLKGHSSPTTVPFPVAVRDFAVAFDARCYPLLHDDPHDRGRPDR